MTNIELLLDIKAELATIKSTTSTEVVTSVTVSLSCLAQTELYAGCLFSSDTDSAITLPFPSQYSAVADVYILYLQTLADFSITDIMSMLLLSNHQQQEQEHDKTKLPSSPSTKQTNISKLRVKLVTDNSTLLLSLQLAHYLGDDKFLRCILVLIGGCELYQYRVLFSTLHVGLRQEIYLKLPYNMAPEELAYNRNFAERWIAVNLKDNDDKVIMFDCDRYQHRYRIKRQPESRELSFCNIEYCYTPALMLREDSCCGDCVWLWHDNGQIAEVLTTELSDYGDGIVIHGPRIVWYDNSKLACAMNYYYGAPVGTWNCYHETGELQSQMRYLDAVGNLITWEILDADYLARQAYIDNYDVQTYYRSGNKATLTRYRNGVQDGRSCYWLNDDENTLSESSYFEYD